MFILDDLMMAPWRFFYFVVEKIHDQAMAELLDESVITRQLLEAQIRYDMGEIDDEEYGKIEEVLINRLHTARELKLQLAEEESENLDESEYGVIETDNLEEDEDEYEEIEDSEEIEVNFAGFMED
ncbi:MAG: Gas vesicle protein G [Pelotomaculum sp. PtaB.Bin013]|uniref:Gas vesicle protein GvpG n=1 Tax=Pelotomaculum isophthalicicum JI TaxID=947010 RepID=A0A9X4H0Y3_9FIRM|nr:gas vesicle protein GvpG [Pelotomaculum isophthalicicum]MDF9407605.1 gas vesicle protein GvpG [Pelotomaculum isophthalicicum JI]OPX81911.1 MAG: Gas vesicle protein G [Pelotomaculum sp. PtaB.Bin013]